MKIAIAIIMATIFGAAMALPAPAAATANPKQVHAAILKGANETGAGDADAIGVGIFGIDTASGEICYLFAHVKLDTVVMAHIHRGVAGANGPVVVPFAAPTEHITKACTTAAPALAAEIAANPSGFYANIHTSAFPAGAIRGQLGP
jgi:CHRD domain-containing protein